MKFTKVKTVLIGMIFYLVASYSGATEFRQIIQDEGIVYQVYVGPRGNLHAGIGHHLPFNEGYSIGDRVSRDLVFKWFWEDYEQSERIAERFAPGAPLEVRDIIINMAFNLGETRLNKFTKLKKAIRDRRWIDAAKEMQNSLWYSHVGSRSKRLVDRMFSFGRSQHYEAERWD